VTLCTNKYLRDLDASAEQKCIDKIKLRTQTQIKTVEYEYIDRIINTHESRKKIR
jgi:hypothetical protein